VTKTKPSSPLNAQAFRIKLKCPSCRLPIVGTTTIGRASAEMVARWIDLGERKTFKVLDSGQSTRLRRLFNRTGHQPKEVGEAVQINDGL